MTTTGSQWAREELGAASLGDARRTARAVAVLAQRAAAPNGSLAQGAGTDADTEATYRFFDNDAIEPSALLAAHQSQTEKRIAAANEPVILAIQDTTRLDYGHHPHIRGMGVIDRENGPGVLLHTTLAVTPQRVPVGIVDQQNWTRPVETVGNLPPHASRSISDKESQKWLTSLTHTAQLQKRHPKTQVVSVGDREADIYDLFLLAQTLPQVLLVRAAWDRRVAHPEERLWAHIAAQPPVGTVTITTPRHEQTPSRAATLTVRCAAVTLRPPKNRAGEHLPSMPVWAVLAEEETPSAGASPIHWLLLTTACTTTLEQACERINWYACRWVVEMYHKVLKSGCRIEERQFDDLENLRRYLAIDSIVAWRVLFMTLQGRQTPALACTTLFDAAEWQALYAFTFKTRTLPAAVPTLAEAILWIARLGGYTDRRKTAHPGTIVIWRGLLRLSDITATWCLFNFPGHI